MENLFNNILTSTSADLTVWGATITMLMAVVFGLVIGFT